VNETTGEFRIVSTCPGAGICKTYCYAMSGNYTRFDSPSMRLTRMLNFLLNDPEGFEAQLIREVGTKAAKLTKAGVKPLVRWHDAGDFFSPAYFDIACRLAETFPDVRFYAYTTMGWISRHPMPDNLVVNFSKDAKASVGGQDNRVDYSRSKKSDTIPRHVFKDFITRDGCTFTDLLGLKYRIAAEYPEYPVDTLITYEDLMNTPEDPTNKLRWNVIIKSGDGDDAAARKDVGTSLLLIH
jgi:hypothetical protein